MTDKITFDNELIRAHAARVDQVASDVGVAQDAASQTDMSGGAFGVLCSFLVTPASMAAGMAHTAIGSAKQMVSRSATEIRGVGDDFQQFEEDAARAIKAMESDLY